MNEMVKSVMYVYFITIFFKGGVGSCEEIRLKFKITSGIQVKDDLFIFPEPLYHSLPCSVLQ